MINFTVFSLIILQVLNCQFKHFQRAILLTVTTVWQSKQVVSWFYLELKGFTWIWDVLFHLFLIASVCILQKKLGKTVAFPQGEQLVVTSDDVKTIGEELEKFFCLFEEVQSGVVITRSRSQSSNGPEDLPG